jgi:ethanolamine ammonia-lyase large subunit
MPKYSIELRGRQYAFADLKEALAKASPPRSGDALAGVAASSARERVAAMSILADLPLQRFLEEPVVPYEIDEVTRLIFDRHDAQAFAPVADLTVGQFREWLLDYATSSEKLKSLAPGLTPEMVAAVSKLCRNQD